MMHFRKKSVADSVVERITAISESVRNGTPLPQSKGAATIRMERSPNGDLLVTKSFENGEPELMTISNQATADDVPEGFTDVTPTGAEQPQPAAVGAAIADQGGIVENAAQGGNALDQLLKT